LIHNLFELAEFTHIRPEVVTSIQPVVMRQVENPYLVPPLSQKIDEWRPNRTEPSSYQYFQMILPCEP
jgi:hypothetical protein